MFGIFKKSKIVRKSDNLNDTTTKWFNGQKVKIKSGTTSQSSRRNQSRKPKNPTWFRETPLPVPSVEKKQMLISSSQGVSKVAILEGPTLVQYYSSDNIGISKVGNIYLGKVKNVLPGMEAAFVSFGEDKNGVLYVADIEGSTKNSKIENLLKTDQEILVQVVKDAMGEKGARLTGQISLPGRYLVLIPNSKTKGISRRLADNERERLDKIISKNKIKCKGEKYDRYKRLIAICYKKKIDLNNWMVKNGLALNYTKYSKKYISSEIQAKREKLGLWKGQFDKPWEWRKKNK